MTQSLAKEHKPFRVYPGRMRLDQNADITVRDDNALVKSENVRLDRFIAERRPGMRKVFTVTRSGTDGSLTFSASAYASFTPPLIGMGGFGFKISITAARPSGGNTAYILSSKVSGKAYGPVTLTLSDAGVITAAFRKESDESEVTAVLSAVADDANVHLLIVYDPVAATWSVCRDGDGEVVTTTGVGTDEQPMQDATDWYFGTDTDGAGSPVANTEFEGSVDAFTLFQFKGIDLSDGLLTKLREWAWFEWTNPGSQMVLACFDFNEATLTDRSRYQNDATITGSPSPAGGVAYTAYTGNFCGIVRNLGGRRDNVIVVGGNLYYETLAGDI